MKKQLLAFLLLFSLSAATLAQQAPEVEQNLRRHVAYLASGQLEGRRTGETGATAAAGYAANVFAQVKLKPGYRGRARKAGFLQPFPYVAGVTLGKDNFLRIIPADPTRENKMEEGVNWMPLGFSPNGYVPPSPAVFAGYGITSRELNHDDYAGLDVRGKIVIMFDGHPEQGNPHSTFGLFNTHRKASLAKDKGARAIILIASESDFRSDRLSRLAYDRTLGETAVPMVGIMRSHGAGLLGVKGDKELAGLQASLGAKSETAASVRDRIAALRPATAQLKVDLVKKEVEAYNVIGILEGRDPVLKNEAIVIGAHYDHLGRGGQGSLAVNSRDIHYGADDNASGTSAVLELARQFAEAKNNKRTIIFMAFGGEEEGLLGSKYYVNNPVWPLDKTVAMINLDMVGRLNDRKLTVGGIGTSGIWRQLVEQRNLQEGDLNGIRILGDPNDRPANATRLAPPRIVGEIRGAAFDLQLNEDGFGPSDHSSFYGKQIPVLFFFTGTHVDYHKPTDTTEKVNYAGLSAITNYVAGIVRAVDQNSLRPAYTVAKSSGVMGGLAGFSVSLGTVPSYADSTDELILDGVRDGSPAAKAGLKPGDKIVKLAGKEVRNAMDYTYVLSEMRAGEEYEVELLRGTERLKLKIIPAAAARR